MSSIPQKFYVTTPIYYVNARPHIGHAYTTIVADVLARRHRLLGEDVFFLTGTDEHGQKIERSAAKAGIAPQAFADEVSASFEALWQRMGITHDKFIRTTDPDHARGVQQLFRTLYDRGHIYLSTYTGAYCVSDEAFVDAPIGTPCPDCGRLLEEVTEENFFFRLNAFQLPLLNLIESGELKIENEARRNEVLSFLRGNLNAASAGNPSSNSEERKGVASATPQTAPVLKGPGFSPANLDATNDAASTAEETQPTPNSVISTEATVSPSRSGETPVFPSDAAQKTAAGTPYVPGALKDLSISRSSFTWGIPVPEDVQQKAGATQQHVIYVWLDALANYMTAIGYGDDSAAAQASLAKWWPADLHLVGKEIIRFHCVYWPAFLLAADLALPKAITAHGWLLFDNSKMSKSKGNIVRTETILEAFGTLCPPSPHSTPNDVILSGAKDLLSSEAPRTQPESVNRKGVASATPQDASSLKGPGFSPANNETEKRRGFSR